MGPTGTEPPVAGAGRHARIGIGQADLLEPARLPAVMLGQKLGRPGWVRLGRSILRQKDICMANPRTLPGHVGANQRRVDLYHLALGYPGYEAGLDGAGDDPVEAFGTQRCRILVRLEWSGRRSVRPKPANRRMARLTFASRSRRRSWTMPSRKPKSIRRSATSGSMPGRPVSGQCCSATASCSQDRSSRGPDHLARQVGVRGLHHQATHAQGLVGHRLSLGSG